MTSRRGFLGAMLAAAAAPAFVRSGILMPTTRKIIAPDAFEEVSRQYTVNLAGSMLRAGDIITIAGMYAAPGMLRQCKVTETAGSVMTLGVC